jgi:2-C-methyl-D-erythritol 4-phosphate cytidylyltransferase
VRMGADRPKQFLPLGRRPVLFHTLRAFANAAAIDEIVLVVPEVEFDYCRLQVIEPLNAPGPIRLVAGGSRRQDSVYNGLSAIATEADPDDLVAIHDGVRPFVDAALIDRCLNGAAAHGACVAAVPVADTIKQVEAPDGDAPPVIAATVARQGLWLAQTPQAFRFGLIFNAHRRIRHTGADVTDDAAVAEAAGAAVTVIEGNRLNFKITTPEDLTLAAALGFGNA